MNNVLLVVSLLLVLPVNAQTVNIYMENLTPDNRYSVNNDGTVTDNVTGLMWMQCSEGQVWESRGGEGNCTGEAIEYKWDAALRIADSKTFAGNSDWRLPDIKELISLVAEDRYDPAINNSVFPVTPSISFWSGSPYSLVSERSWLIDFTSGGRGFGVRDYRRGVRLVRSAK